MVEYRKNTFQLNYFNKKDIKQILQLLSGKDWMNLLLACKSWNNAILPVMWEDMESKIFYPNLRQVKKSYIKYGHYIKRLDFTSNITLPINRKFYPNATHLFTSLSYYLENRFRFEGLLLDKLIYDDSDGALSFEDFILINEIEYKYIFRNLSYLKVTSIDDFFKDEIIHILPPTILSLVLSTSITGNLLLELLNKFKLLKHLDAERVRLNKQEYELFTKEMLPHLQNLSIRELEAFYHNEITINFNFLPKLNKLHLGNRLTLKFIEVSNLTHLSLSYINLRNTLFTLTQFPNLKILKIAFCSFLSSRHVYSFLKLPKLTYLHIVNYQTSIFLLDDIYPNEFNNLIYLKLRGINLGYSFLNYFNKFCLNVEILQLEYTPFNFNFLELRANEDNNIKPNLVNLTIKNYYTCPGLMQMVEYILKLFHNIKVINVPKINGLSQNVLIKYSHLLKT